MSDSENFAAGDPPPTYPSNLSDRLEWAMAQKAGRTGVKLRYADLVRAASVTAAAGSMWKANQTGLNANTARLLGEFLEVAPVWLENGFGEPDDPTKQVLQFGGFGVRLKEARLARELPIKALAAALSCTEQAIWNYENRPGGITADKLFTLADLLGVSARWLAIGADDGVVARVTESSEKARRVQALACLRGYVRGDKIEHDLLEAAITILSD